MAKNKKNNKGFTIIELIIAISIFSVVIFMGYKVINGSNKVSASQAEISKEQQSANLINKYLTKDLEVAKSIKSFGIGDSGKLTGNEKSEIKYGYDITIDNNGMQKDIKYEVDINQSQNKYSIVRKDDNKSIEIISDQKYEDLSQGLPFVVSKEEDLYCLNLLIGDNSYEFNVNSRIKVEDASINPPTPPGGGDDLNAKGNIVIDKSENTVDVTISDTVKKDEYKPRIAVKKYDNQRRIYLYLNDNKTEYEFEFSRKCLNIKTNGYSKEIYGDGTEVINNERFKFDFYSEDRDIKIYKNDIKIIDIDTDGNDDVEISLFDNTRNEVDIEIEGDEVELDFGDSDFSKTSTYKNATEEIEVEISKYLVEDVKSIDIEAINTEIDLEGDDKGFLTKILGLNPKDYYDDDELELDMDTKYMQTGSSVIINFNKEDIKPLIHACGIQFLSKKVNEESTVTINSIKCDHSSEVLLLDVLHQNINKGVLEIDFINKLISIEGNNFDKQVNKVDFNKVPQTIKIDIDGNGTIDYTKTVNDGKVTVEDIKVNASDKKTVYKIYW